MYTAGRKSNDDVSLLHSVLVQNLILVDNTEGETGEVILVLRVKAGHFSGLSTREDSTRLYTALCHTRDDGCNALRVVLAAGNVVEEY